MGDFLCKEGISIAIIIWTGYCNNLSGEGDFRETLLQKIKAKGVINFQINCIWRVACSYKQTRNCLLCMVIDSNTYDDHTKALLAIHIDKI